MATDPAEAFEVELPPLQMSEGRLAELVGLLKDWSGAETKVEVDGQAHEDGHQPEQRFMVITTSKTRTAKLVLATYGATMDIEAAEDDANELYQTIKAKVTPWKKPLWQITHGDGSLLVGASLLLLLLWLLPGQRALVALVVGTLWLAGEVWVTRNQTRHYCSFGADKSDNTPSKSPAK